MMLIFFLGGFGPFFDSIRFNILGRHERRKAASLGVANVISAMMVEYFSWFFYRWWLSLDNDPKKGFMMQASDWTTNNLGNISIPRDSVFGSFVIPYWYIIAITVAGVFYYYAFKRSNYIPN
jgi:predicted permease